ncbi:hypothetical protein E0K99_03335 [Faecalicoccus pleomorphus]|uniref:ABC-three component system protein n=1 Tax=Faecalicoccus pleomorphus TaxID=1323 RepID=UPI001431AF6E|nr:ABC-three component system protein [Faecalicoccus pleomorphus]NJE40356.1 hypothetical protein [Faecalicoccus pleomorphus]
MRIFNYQNYTKALEKGLNKKDITEMAQVLFEPLIDGKKLSVLNKNNEPYYINSSTAKRWYDGKEDIPNTIKDASNNEEVIKHVQDYFDKQILKKYILPLKKSEALSAILELVNDSNLNDTVKEELISYYDSQKDSLFVSMSFLYALNQSNLIKEVENEKTDDNGNLSADNVDYIPPKPQPIKPPSEIATEELVYVEELYRVYSEKSNEKCTCEKDLEKHTLLKKNFNAQRKNYYSAETVRRGLRDTMIEGEIDSFENLKDEIYEGVIDVRDREYDLAYDRLNAVMSHVTTVSTSYNLDQKLLGWIGPAEKKGVCHMLVNDHRLSWMEGEEDDK